MEVETISLLDAFRSHYARLTDAVHAVVNNPTDPVVIERLCNDLSEYTNLVDEHVNIFEDLEELNRLQSSLALMMDDARISYQQSVDQSHSGLPTVIQRVQTGRRGRPAVEIDPQFLQWAHNRRSISSLARFLGVGRTTLRNALLRQGLLPHAQGIEQPVEELQNQRDEIDDVANHQRAADNLNAGSDDQDDQLLEPDLPFPEHLDPSIAAEFHDHEGQLSNENLDNTIKSLRTYFRRAGVRMLDGMLRRLGHQVPQQRIRESLLRIDPVRRVFERIRIRRRQYTVPGPNALWHHDGQHGLIRWGIVIHGFIDGYSRLITGLQASSNNHGSTVLTLFLEAVAIYGIPSRLRGDHGTENILIAAWMEERNGRYRGSYIWGRSVHNVRIERLWVDITAQIGTTWANLFTLLELHHGLNINNRHHIWLLHFLFLPTLNHILNLFAGSWNEHRITIRDGPNRSPIDMFNFDMLVHGVRGTDLSEAMTAEELEVFGIDWEGLQEDRLVQAQRENNRSDEPPTSWIGRQGPPAHLNEIFLEDPDLPLTYEECIRLEQIVSQWVDHADDDSLVSAWSYGLAFVRQIRPDVFF